MNTIKRIHSKKNNTFSHFLDFTDYEERKAAMKSGKKPASKTKFFTRPGKAEKQ